MVACILYVVFLLSIALSCQAHCTLDFFDVPLLNHVEKYEFDPPT